jgi:chaperonin GroES
MKIKKLTKGRVLVQPDLQQEKTKSGIYLPPVAQKKSDTGTIVMINPETSELKSGVKVVFQKGTGDKMEYAGKDCILMRTDALMCYLIEK